CVRHADTAAATGLRLVFPAGKDGVRTAAVGPRNTRRQKGWQWSKSIAGKTRSSKRPPREGSETVPFPAGTCLLQRQCQCPGVDADEELKLRVTNELRRRRTTPPCAFGACKTAIDCHRNGQSNTADLSTSPVRNDNDTTVRRSLGA